MAPPQLDFKSIGGRLLRSQTRESSSTTIDSDESTIIRRIDYAGDSNNNRNNVNRLELGLGEGQKFELMIDTVILADRTLKAVRGTYTKCIGVKLRWGFLDKDVTTRIVQVRDNEIPVGELYTYYIPVNDLVATFFNDRIIHFDVFAVYPNKEKLVGFSELNLCDCAGNLNMQLGKCLDLLYITKQKCCTGSKMKNIGRLLIQYKLYSRPENKNCEIRELIETIHRIPRSSFSSLSSKTETIDSKFSSNEMKIKNSLGVLEKIVQNISENDLTLNDSGKNKKDNVNDDQEYLFDFFPISSTQNKNDIKSQDDLKKDLKLKPLSFTNIPLKNLHQTPITIIINSLKFNEDFGQILKPNMTYYIEYSFLEKEGLETLNFPLSSDYSTIFNAMTTFKLDIKRNIKDYRTIFKMVTTKRYVKFIVVEESIVDTDKIPICYELGYSNVYLCDTVNGKNTNEYPLLSMNYPHKQIGLLNIEIIGLKNVIDFVEKRQVFGITQEKSKSLDNFEMRKRLDRKENVEIEIGVKPNDEIHQVFLKEIEGNLNNPSSKLKNMLKGRSNSVTFKTSNKVTRGDIITNLNINSRKSMNTKRKKIERARLNRRFARLICDDFKENQRSHLDVLEKEETQKLINN